MHRRGLSDETISRAVLGVTLSDPDSLVDHLRATCPEAFPYAEEAGLVITDDDGHQCTHWNLRGRLLLPYIVGGEVVDLRTRTYDGGKGYRSLGPYVERGATFPFGWDNLAPGTRSVIITEAEFKALAALQAFHAGELDMPTLGQPGLNVFREEWARQLAAQGVEEVVLCYDRQQRPTKDGVPAMAPEEQWSLRHGAACAAAGLRVRVARLPLAPGETKAEIDTFLPREGAARFQQLIATAPLLLDYHRSFNRGLLERHNLQLPNAYPTRRERPRRLSIKEQAAAFGTTPADAPSVTLPEARAQRRPWSRSTRPVAPDSCCWPILPAPARASMPPLACVSGCGRFPPMTTAAASWSGRRSARPSSTISRASSLSRSWAGIRAIAASSPRRSHSLRRATASRMPLRPVAAPRRPLRLPEQFGQEGDFFASTPLLKATGWWEQAGVVDTRRV